MQAILDIFDICYISEISRIASITQQVIVCGAATFFDRHNIDGHFLDEDYLDSLINETGQILGQ
jgi:hypothetical protein